MQNFLELLSLLPTGHITLGFIITIILLLLLIFVEYLGNIVIKHLLAFDDKNAPEFTPTRHIDELFCKMFLYVDRDKYLREYGKGWTVHCKNDKDNCYAIEGDTSWYSRDYVLQYCVFENKQDAIKLRDKKYSQDELLCGRGYLLGYCIMIDIGLLLFSVFPTLTITLSSIGMLFFGIRLLAKKVWANTTKLKNHDERIDKLEGKE